MPHKAQHFRLLLSMIACTAAWLVLAAPSIAAPEGWLTSLDEARKQAEERNAMVLVDLYADWCGWCKVLEKKVFADPEFREFAADYVLLHVDVEDGGEGSQMQARFEARNLPTTLILSPRLAKVGQVTGYADTRNYIAKIQQRVRSWQGLIATYEQARQSSDPQVLRGLAQEMHSRGDGARAAALYEQLREALRSEPDRIAWLHYLLADAYRLDQRYGEARSTLGKARQLASSVQDGDLDERMDLLSFQIAQDGGDCNEVKTSLESFLQAHPKSNYGPRARRTLDALKRGDLEACT